MGDDVASDYLSKAMQSMERARGLTQQLLTFSQGGAPVKEVASLIPLIRETSLFALSGSKVLSVVDMPTDLWPCDIDKSQIGQVVQNIVLNAVQAMPTGGTIGIRAQNVTLADKEVTLLNAGDYVRASFKDQGIGMSEEMLPRIFDPFFTTKTKGHGLGLAISHSIVTRHGGAIEVESRLGKGTIFHVYLPACPQRAAPDRQTVTIEHKGIGRVLVMDDEQPLRAVLSRMLQSFGYSTLCEASGKGTIEAFVHERENNREFIAVILDLTIPGGIGGAEVCEAIRRLDAGIPIFVASGYANDPIMSNPLEYGFTASLGKPFTRTELAAMLEKHVRRNS